MAECERVTLQVRGNTHFSCALMVRVHHPDTGRVSQIA